MAKLAEPKLVSVKVSWLEDHEERKKTFYEMLGLAIRKRAATEREEVQQCK